MSTYRADTSFLKNAQQLDLHRGRHFAYFIKKYSSTVGGLEQSFTIGVRTGEGSLYVAEQLGFEQCLSKRTTVDRNERLLRARAEIVDRTGNQFFSGSALAGKQDRRLDLGYGLDHLKDRIHLGGCADNILDTAAFTLGAFEGAVFVDQRLFLKRLTNDQLEFLDVERFLNKIVSSELERLAGCFDRRKRCHQNDANVRQSLANRTQHFDTVHVGHLDVRDDNVRRFGLEQI